MVNINNLNDVRREYPNWNQRGRIKKVDEHGNLVADQFSFNGEVVRVSPRYQKHGSNYRVRPERPTVFFAAFCFESGLLPTALTPEECESEPGLAILEPLWAAYKHHFPKLESPFAASDHATEPSLKVGYSFCVLQVLVESIGAVRNGHAQPTPRLPTASTTTSPNLDAIRRQIEQMRNKTATPAVEATPAKETPTVSGKPKKG